MPFLALFALASLALFVACGGDATSDDDGAGGEAAGEEGCAPGSEPCDGACVDTDTHARHCGACGVSCQPSEVCKAGECTCDAGRTSCGDECLDTRSDGDHCGSCTRRCAGGTTCEAGACVCAPGETSCQGTCVDLALSTEHCGACGNACAPVEDCVEGVCLFRGPGGDGCGGPARDIEITKVAVYQALEVPLYEGGQLFPSDERTVELITDRDAMVRVFVDPDGDFEPRELSARVTIQTQDGLVVRHHKRTVTGASTQGSLTSTFRVEVPAALVRAETSIRVDLVECDQEFTGDLGGSSVPDAPSEFMSLDARETGPVTVAFVPVEHDSVLPDTSEESLAIYIRAVETQFPTTRVLASVTSPIPSQQSGYDVDLDELLTRVHDKRGADQPEDHVYYYGLVRPAPTFDEYCLGSGCTVGIAYIADGGSFGADERVGLGIAYGEDLATDEAAARLSAETFLHELGHNHGRQHTPGCVEGDPTFPREDGTIGYWGYDLDGAVLRAPTSYFDFMGYCDPYWVSEVTWEAIAKRIASDRGVAFRQEFGRPEPRLLDAGPRRYAVVHVTPQGLRFGAPVTKRGVPSSPPESAVVLGEGGEPLLSVPVHRVRVGDGASALLYVPEKEPGWVSLRFGDGTEIAF